MKLVYVFLFISCLFTSCKVIKKSNNIPKNSFSKKASKNLTLHSWYQKDFILDKIPGISLDKWYNENKQIPKSKPIIVAVIDTQIDLKHEDLQGQLWTNVKEIPDNKIDDDNNGFIDDINGWCFTGTINGGYLVWANFECVRYLREWNSLFIDKTESEIATKDIANFKEYRRALKALEKEKIYYYDWHEFTKYSVALYPVAKDSLKHYFPKENYTYLQLDSLYQKKKINDKTYKQRKLDNDRDLGALIGFMIRKFEKGEKTFEDVKETDNQLDSIVNKNLNFNYDDRKDIGDNLKVLEKGYGNNNVSNNKLGYSNIQDHCTKVSGIIAANRNNNNGMQGICQNAKIMPLSISQSGDEQDKDIAMAIYYAVDNGAKVINMSFGKEFSVHKQWVFDAFKYAEAHNVLLVHGSGNERFNVDENPYYPSDVAFDSSQEVCGNFINVGSITQKADNTFVSKFSNYGKQNVDLFAPGDKIYTTTYPNTYKTDSGTSLAAPMVSGTAALIWSYYPKLTVQEVKQIILDSGTSYDLEVIVPGTEDKKVSFSELSKSGKVLNVYNAMMMAEKMSRK